ncbi:hypothetical protein SAMN05216226_10255 [Halovenus aranensis]|jgi:hypothetical protein|uniref:Uncharacterized protein n=1 Tax=Halovenus aranensis TaxID=890420 RepID=A0A1G8SP79_9EURY|nr:hypothetical protein [Halovenus aranensis]SDJ30545.1 hypothetical protein SAMN05216226_10255 [Halovenus aranensis]
MSVDSDWTAFEYQPPTAGAAAALGGSFVAAVALASFRLSLAVGVTAGGFLLAAGLFRGSHRIVTAGAGVMFGALCLLVGTDGAVVPALVAAGGIVVAYDAGRYTVRIGSQVGADGRATRAVVSHVGQTAGVTAASGVVGAGIYYVSPTQQPESAVVVLLAAVTLLISGLVLAGSASRSG